MGKLWLWAHVSQGGLEALQSRSLSCPPVQRTGPLSIPVESDGARLRAGGRWDWNKAASGFRDLKKGSRMCSESFIISEKTF